MNGTGQQPTPFVGRTAELELLQQTWQRVETGEPQFLVWTADTGLGKTRLVQAFFEWLSTERDATEPAGYWPDSLDIAGHTLSVNPAFAPSDGPRPAIPWLWWGLRFSYSRYERGIAASSCGLVNAKEHLAPHLEPLVRARHGRELATDGLRITASIWATVFSAGLVGAALYGLDVHELNQARRKLDAPLPGIAKQQASERRDAVEDLLALFRDLFRGLSQPAGAGGTAEQGSDGKAQSRKRRIPCALILDDAHWADPDTLRFIEALYLDAVRGGWPLLVLCTHWEQEWNLQRREARTPCASADPRSIADVCERIANRRGGRGAGCCRVEPLQRLQASDLRAVLTVALPGLTAGQTGALLERVGGNPGFVVDLVAYARTRPHLFGGRDSTRSLTESGARQLLKIALLDHHQLIRKRFDELDGALRQALAIASYQGARFLEELLLEIARRLDEPCTEQDLARARDPHAIIERVTPPAMPPASEFSQRAWHEIAVEELAAQHKDDTQAAAFRTTLRQILTDWRNSGRITDLDPRDQILALNLLASELGRALDAAAKTDVPTLALLGGTLADLVGLYASAADARRAAEAAAQLAQWQPIDGWPADWIALPYQHIAAVSAYFFAHHADAMRLYDSVIAGYESTQVLSSDPTKQNDLAGVYSDRGVAHYDQGNIPGAIADYGRAIDILAPLIKHLGDQAPPAMRNHLAAIYENRGNARTALSDPSDLIEALADHNSSLEIRDYLKDALGENITPSMEKDRAQVYMNRGSLRQRLCDLPGAMIDLSHALKLLEMLREKLCGRWPLAMQHHLAQAYFNRGNLKQRYGQRYLAGAITDYDLSIEFMTTLRKTLGDQWRPAMQMDLASAYANRGTARGRMNQHDAAAVDFLEAIELARPLAATNPAIPTWREILKQAKDNLAYAQQMAAGGAAD